MSLETRDQEYMDRTELEVAIEYAEIAAKYGVPVTLFITGKAAVEEPERVRQLARMDHVEIGGHNYYAFDTPVHMTWRAVEKLSGGIVGSWNGPHKFQQWEISRTKSVLNDLGASVTSWRDHAYRSDNYTEDLLKDAGIIQFSDVVGPDERIQQKNGVTIVPVNTPPDHEHVYHAFRKPGSNAVESFDGPFGGDSVEIDEWTEWILDRIKTIRADDEVATVLAHPSCLWLADQFDSFEWLCEEICDFVPRRMDELPSHKRVTGEPNNQRDTNL